jgi:hypothetical protein
MIVNSKSRFALLETKTTSPSTNGDSDGHGHDQHGNDSSHGKQPPGQTSGTAATTGTPTITVVGCTNQFDFRSVVTHEAGHFFGLGEDMQDGSATMYYSTKPCDIGKRDLKATDASEVTSLYATAEPSAEDDKGSAQKCSVGNVGERSGTGTAWAVALLSLSLAVRRARRARTA